jgi:thioredoxin 1
MIAPMVAELASEYSGSVKVGKINIDNSPQSAQTYGISGIPTLIIFKAGDVVERIVGVPAKARLQQALDAAQG